ncbi:hypothetical protein CHS0354_035220 [Potamilus streckersoni]|uniref:Uncharacterized protein n=1 Tax=Potamilus streckersoni TaxID=2493646 RepID=A0AAE0S395_9BIVA|nr:hypothetical protein CHS0354_035220 [Potamilus streckersoni]
MFRFRLAKLLNLKAEEEKIRLRRLNEVLAKIMLFENEISTARAKIKQSRESLHKKITSNRAQVPFIDMQSAYERNMGQVVVQKQTIIAKLREYEKICRKQYEEIYFQRKALENLREKQLEAYTEDKKRKETRYYDDITVTHFAVQRKNENVSLKKKPLECRLTLSPLNIECLNDEELKKERKLREDVFVPESQIEVFKNLEKKEQELNKQGEQQNIKTAELRQIEERIERKLNDLRKEREEYEALRKQRIEMDQKDISKIITYYERMDPENASKFINSMDLDTASHILMRMNPRKGAKIMELLDAPRAVQITERVAVFKRNLAEVSRLENPNRTVPDAVN